jgi:hypothetical protein
MKHNSLYSLSALLLLILIAGCQSAKQPQYSAETAIRIGQFVREYEGDQKFVLDEKGTITGFNIGGMLIPKVTE